MQIDWNKSDEELQKDSQAAEEDGRKNKKHVKRVLFTIFSVILLCIGAFITFLGYETYLENSSRERMNTIGVETTAILNDQFTQITRGTRGDPKTSYEVSYTIMVDNHSYVGTSELSSRPTSHQEIAIYDPQNPKMNKLKRRIAVKQEDSFFSDRVIAKVVYIVIIAFVLGFMQKLMRKKS